MIAQPKIAVDFDLACVIHSVKSYSECLAIRKQWKSKCRPWVFHDFNSNEQMASAIIKSGCYLSLSPRMIKHYEMNPKKYSYLETLDLDFIFLETDDDLKINILDMFVWFSSLRDIDIHTLNNKFWKNLELITGKTMSAYWLSRAELLLQDKIHNLEDAHVAVVGLGGIGGFAVECLVRAG